ERQRAHHQPQRLTNAEIPHHLISRMNEWREPSVMRGSYWHTVHLKGEGAKKRLARPAHRPRIPQVRPRQRSQAQAQTAAGLAEGAALAHATQDAANSLAVRLPCACAPVAPGNWLASWSSD